jgi:hypothetical protein
MNLPAFCKDFWGDLALDLPKKQLQRPETCRSVSWVEVFSIFEVSGSPKKIHEKRKRVVNS